MAAGQRKFLLVAVDYFSKWVEAEPLAQITEREVLNFLWKNIVCRYGIPRRLINMIMEGSSVELTYKHGAER